MLKDYILPKHISFCYHAHIYASKMLHCYKLTLCSEKKIIFMLKNN